MWKLNLLCAEKITEINIIFLCFADIYLQSKLFHRNYLELFFSLFHYSKWASFNTTN